MFSAVFVGNHRLSRWHTDERKADECLLKYLDIDTLCPDAFNHLGKPHMVERADVPLDQLGD